MWFFKRRSPQKPQYEWVKVAYAANQFEAEVMAGLLRTEQIPSFIQQESVGRVWGLSVGPLGMITLLVPAEFEKVATALLAPPVLDSSPPDVDEPLIPV